MQAERCCSFGETRGASEGSARLRRRTPRVARDPELHADAHPGKHVPHGRPHVARASSGIGRGVEGGSIGAGLPGELHAVVGPDWPLTGRQWAAVRIASPRSHQLGLLSEESREQAAVVDSRHVQPSSLTCGRACAQLDHRHSHSTSEWRISRGRPRTLRILGWARDGCVRVFRNGGRHRAAGSARVSSTNVAYATAARAANSACRGLMPLIRRPRPWPVPYPMLRSSARPPATWASSLRASASLRRPSSSGRSSVATRTET